MTSNHKLIITLLTAASVTAYCFLDIQLNFQAGIQGSIRSTNTVIAERQAVKPHPQPKPAVFNNTESTDFYQSCILAGATGRPIEWCNDVMGRKQPRRVIQ